MHQPGGCVLKLFTQNDGEEKTTKSSEARNHPHPSWSKMWPIFQIVRTTLNHTSWSIDITDIKLYIIYHIIYICMYIYICIHIYIYITHHTSYIIYHIWNIVYIYICGDTRYKWTVCAYMTSLDPNLLDHLRRSKEPFLGGNPGLCVIQQLRPWWFQCWDPPVFPMGISHDMVIFEVIKGWLISWWRCWLTKVGTQKKHYHKWDIISTNLREILKYRYQSCIFIYCNINHSTMALPSGNSTTP